MVTRGPILLGVNIDHVATLRQARGTQYPNPVQAAMEAQHAGADAITIHLREDRRHIQERDVELLAAVLQVRMNLEMAVTDAMLALAERIRPADCCFVPERRQELTTEGGLDVAANSTRFQGRANVSRVWALARRCLSTPTRAKSKPPARRARRSSKSTPDAMRTRRIPARESASSSVSLRRVGWPQVRGCESMPDTGSIIRTLAQLRL